MSEPTTEQATDVTETKADDVTEPVAEVVARPAAEPKAEPAPEPGAEPTAEATADVAANAGAEPAAKPTREPGAEPTAVATAEASRERPAGRRQAQATPAAREGRPSANGAPRRLRERYTRDVVPALVKQFSYRNQMEVPRLTKIVVNIGLGEALTNAKAIDAAVGDLAMITGQRPIITRATRSIAQFRLRTGNPIGAKVTLRGERMWDFLDRLTSLALPRIRDFRGIPGRSFDGRGNYSLGFREQLAFPEIDYDKVDRLRGLEVSIVTTAKSDEESKRLLELLGMPFAG